MVNSYDVIIVGAGLSGAYCASLLKKYGLKIAVLESSPRMGGRLKSIRDDKGGYELGGTYIGNSYQRVINAANRIGLELIDVSNLLSFFKQQDLVIDGEIIAQSEWPSHKKNILDSKLKHIMPWNLHRTLLKKHNPFNTTEACLSDMSFKDCSMGDWLRSLNFNEDEIQIIYGMNVSYGCNAEDISLLQLLHRSTFSSVQSNKTKQSGLTLKKGMTSLVEGLVAENNLEIFLNHKVTDIYNETNHYLIKSNNLTIKAKHLVVTVPPACIKNISLKNVIPERLLAMLKSLSSQPMIQVHFKVKHPFWENDNYAPSLFSNELFGMCHEVRHLSSPEEIKGLTSWVMGEQAKKLLRFSPQEAAKIILNQYNLIRPSSKNNIEISSIAPWSHDENFQGGWVYFQPNEFKAFHEELKKLDSCFCLAGEYTAKAARGMEGAMESGEAAAEKIISQLC